MHNYHSNIFLDCVDRRNLVAIRARSLISQTVPNSLDTKPKRACIKSVLQLCNAEQQVGVGRSDASGIPLRKTLDSSVGGALEISLLS